MALKKSAIISGLKRKGFRERKGKQHHIFLYLYVNGKMTNIRTKISHSNTKKGIQKAIIKKMAFQVGLSIKQFKELIECPLSYENYIKILKENGKIIF